MKDYKAQWEQAGYVTDLKEKNVIDWGQPAERTDHDA